MPTASRLTLDDTCDVSAAAGAGGTPADGSITNAKLANMAQDRIKGRVSSGSGVPEDLTGAQVKTMAGAVGPSVGTVDNAIVRADGTGGATTQGSELFVGDAGFGSVELSTAPVSGGNSNAISIRSGQTTSSGNSGNVGLDVGTAAGTAGVISIGTTNASALTIGRSGVTTTINGTVALANALAVTSGGTGATTAGGARTNLAAAGSGAVGSSGLTMTTARLLGRTTASTGAVEEITVGSGLSLSGGALTASGGGDTIAQANGTQVAINSTSVVQLVSTTNTLAAGNTLDFQLNGYIINDSGGTKTYTVRVTIGATTFDLAFDGTTAASSTNVAYVRVFAEVSIISSSLIACTINVRRGIGAALGTPQNNVLAQDRSIVRTSTNNETGSKTVAIGLFSSDATSAQTFTITRATIRK